MPRKEIASRQMPAQVSSAVFRSFASIPLALGPRQSGRFPAVGPATMSFEIGIAFKPTCNVESLPEAGSCHGDRRGAGAPSGPAQKQEWGIETCARRPEQLRNLRSKIRVRAHIRKSLPLDLLGTTIKAGEVGNADEGPLCRRAHIDKLGARVPLQNFPSFLGIDIASVVWSLWGMDHGRSSRFRSIFPCRRVRDTSRAINSKRRFLLTGTQYQPLGPCICHHTPLHYSCFWFCCNPARQRQQDTHINSVCKRRTAFETLQKLLLRY